MDFKIFLICFAFLIANYSLKSYIVLFSLYEYATYLFDSNDDTSAYDYIIVGCGTAGSLIAHRLSSHENNTFVVLEAGGLGGPLLNAPAIGPLLQGTSHDWQYETIEQSNACFAMKDKKCKWPSGKIVGGSSKLNNMVHIINYIDEVVSWFEGKYTFEKLAEHLYILENFDLKVEPLNYRTQLVESILSAAKEHYNESFNKVWKSKLGFMETVVNQYNGARWTTSHTFSNHHIKNGKIISNAFVEKIIIDATHKKAKGVLYERFGKKKIIVAKKGVILTSGAIGTPKLLLISGIGPKNHLKELEIKLIKDLPVGHNLQDHVSTGLDLILLNTSLNFNLQNLLSPFSAWDYLFNGVGPLTAPGCEVVAFIDTFNKNHPNLQFMVLPVGIASDHGLHLKDMIGITEDVWKNYFQKVSLNNSISILPIVLHPHSTGQIKLQSKNPTELPLINPNYFSNEMDIKVVIEGINTIKKLLETKSMAKLGAYLNPLIFPGCEDFIFDTYEYWVCYVKHLTLTTYHPSGTCRLGDSKHKSTVVDFNFKVIGIDNLFVADASVFPNIPSGNINTAVAMVASLFVEEILSRSFENIPNSN